MHYALCINTFFEVPEPCHGAHLFHYCCARCRTFCFCGGIAWRPTIGRRYMKTFRNFGRPFFPLSPHPPAPSPLRREGEKAVRWTAALILIALLSFWSAGCAR